MRDEQPPDTLHPNASLHTNVKSSPFSCTKSSTFPSVDSNSLQCAFKEDTLTGPAAVADCARPTPFFSRPTGFGGELEVERRERSCASELPTETSNSPLASEGGCVEGLQKLLGLQSEKHDLKSCRNEPESRERLHVEYDAHMLYLHIWIGLTRVMARRGIGIAGIGSLHLQHRETDGEVGGSSGNCVARADFGVQLCKCG